MAEPRRPRIIRTRPGSGPSEPAVHSVPAGTAVPAGIDAPGNPAPPAAAHRPTSSKVTVVPLPADGLANEESDSSRADSAVSLHTVAPPRASTPARAEGHPRQDPLPQSPDPGNAAPAGPQSTPPAGPLATSKRPARQQPAQQTQPAQPLQHAQPAPAPGGAGAKLADPDSGAKDGSPTATVLAFPKPAYLRRRRRIWLGAAAVAAVLALVMVVALYSSVLAVKTISFEGRKLVADKTLQAALEPLVGKPLPQVTQGEVDALLAKVPQVKSSRIEAKPPSTLLVQLVERVPVALLKNGAGYVLVDKDGVQLGTTNDPATVSLPLIDGGMAAVGKDTFKAITAVLATLPQPVLVKLSSASAKSPDAVELQLADGKLVVWGNASDMVLKSQVLQALLTAPAPTSEPGMPDPAPVKVYDVSAPRHPVTR